MYVLGTKLSIPALVQVWNTFSDYIRKAVTSTISLPPNMNRSAPNFGPTKIIYKGKHISSHTFTENGSNHFLTTKLQRVIF